jgi:hypothetical protein
MSSLQKPCSPAGNAEKGYIYRVETTSKDGLVYHGNWGYPDLGDSLVVELKRFEAKDKEVILLGQ